VPVAIGVVLAPRRDRDRLSRGASFEMAVGL